MSLSRRSLRYLHNLNLAYMSAGYLPFFLSFVTPPGENAVPVAVLATASPVKFQKNCTLALGKDGWETYARSAAYPLSAKAVESKEEVEGVLMTKGNGEELKVAQKQWEVGLRKIIENFGAV